MPTRRLAGLDGHRGLAALAVLVCHVGQHAAPGGPVQPLSDRLMLGANGLTVFFVLSGFLLYRPFAAAMVGTGGPVALGSYLRARAARIVPAHLVVLAVAAVAGCLIVRTPTGPFGDAPLIGRPAWPVLLADTSLTSSLLPGTMLTGIPPEWSLGAEVGFYLTLPLLAAIGTVLLKRAPRTVRALLPAAIMVVVGAAATAFLAIAVDGTGPGVRYALEWGATPTAVLARSMPTQAALFGLGMLVAAGFELRRGVNAPAPSPLLRVVLLVAAALLMARGGIGDELVGKHLVGIGTAMLVWALVEPTSAAVPTALARVLDAPLLRRLGEISYGVYLWHFPVMLWLIGHGLTLGGSGGLLVDVLVVTTVTLALAVVTHLAVERPVMRSRRTREGGRLVPVA